MLVGVVRLEDRGEWGGGSRGRHDGGRGGERREKRGERREEGGERTNSS